mmetsp:Transcript_865/g.3187  ORF Transcript_865/g.3187 Transcript_865/m.3187 type:complete len:293 (-) Transcript_865:3239-4117(-)
MHDAGEPVPNPNPPIDTKVAFGSKPRRHRQPDPAAFGCCAFTSHVTFPATIETVPITSERKPASTIRRIWISKLPRLRAFPRTTYTPISSASTGTSLSRRTPAGGAVTPKALPSPSGSRVAALPNWSFAMISRMVAVSADGCPGGHTSRSSVSTASMTPAEMIGPSNSPGRSLLPTGSPPGRETIERMVTPTRSTGAVSTSKDPSTTFVTELQFPTCTVTLYRRSVPRPASNELPYTSRGCTRNITLSPALKKVLGAISTRVIRGASEACCTTTVRSNKGVLRNRCGYTRIV